MGNVFVVLPVPAGDGVGAWVDTSGMAPDKTISVDGGAFSGTLFIESSNDGEASACPVDVGTFTGGTAAPQDVKATIQFMRVRRTASTGGPLGAPTVTVAAESTTANVFGAMAVPASDGIGAGIDLSAGGNVNTFNVVGPFSGQVFIDISVDAGATWSPAFLVGLPNVTTMGSAVGTNVLGVLAQARVRRFGSVPSGPAPLISVGSGSDVGGGGSPVSDDWFTVEADAQAADAPTLTQAYPWTAAGPTPAYPPGSFADAGLEGGWIKWALTGSVSWSLLSFPTVWQNLKTSAFGFSFEAIFANIASSQYSFVGLTNGTAGTNVIAIGTIQALDGTHIIAFGDNGAATTKIQLGVADGLKHTVRGTSDGTTVKLYFDNVLKGTLTLASEPNFPTTAGQPGFATTVGATGFAVLRAVYSAAVE